MIAAVSFDLTWFSFVTVHVFLYQAERPMVACHLFSRGCGMTRSCVLNARFPTEYDSKGYGPMRLAGHTLKHWPVSSRPCDCRTSRPALHRVAWEAGFLTHNFGTRNSFTRKFLTHNSFTLIHNYFTTSSHPTLAHTHNCFTLIHHTFLTHTH